MKPNHAITAVIASLFVFISVAHAAPSAADKCEASKNKIAGSYFACLQKAEATAITKMTAPDYSKCTAKFDDKWDGAESKGEGMCPDVVLTAAMNAYIADTASDVTAIVDGAALPSCGDDAINVASEHCDGAALDGKTCADFGYAYGTLQCSGACEFDVGDCRRCPGAAYLGECYVLGAQGADCDSACSTFGMVYDAATAYDVGSEGTDVDCANVLNVLGVPGAGVQYSGGDCIDGFGCGFDGTNRVRCAPIPTTVASAAYGTLARACACH